MTQGESSKKDIWASIDPRQIEEFGDDIVDPEKIAIWSQVFFYGGNTLRLWNEATELKMALLTACSLQNGQNIVLIGKYADESGITRALSSLIGQGGHIILEEIGPRAVTCFKNIHANPRERLQWDFNYFDSIADDSIDRVILFNVASHVGNWTDCSQQIYRVLRRGGKVIIADAPWGGKALITAAHLDTHLEGILVKLLSGMQIGEEDLPTMGPEELNEIFKPFLGWSRSFSWRGLYLFYGEKAGNEEFPSFKFPVSTEDVQVFLTEKPCKTPWDFLASAEIDVLGQELIDKKNRYKWARVINWGAGFSRLEKYDSVMKPFWDNLKVEPGYKALVIGEGLERIWIPELKKRMEGTGEIADFEISPTRGLAVKNLPKLGTKRHQFDYPFADTYPDEYFNLVWLPQGVHHGFNWKEIAPKLLRVLKTHGQVMMLESRTGNPEFFTGLNMSGLMKCTAEKIWWAWNVSFDNLPDCPAAVLSEAFGDLITDTYSLEWKGWLLFWGYKK